MTREVSDKQVYSAIDTMQKYLRQQFHLECGDQTDDMHWTCANCRAALLSRELASFANQLELIGPVAD